MDSCNVQFDRLPLWKQRRLTMDVWAMCNRFLAQPGAREFLTEFEKRARAEGLLSPKLLAAMDEPETAEVI